MKPAKNIHSIVVLWCPWGFDSRTLSVGWIHGCETQGYSGPSVIFYTWFEIITNRLWANTKKMVQKNRHFFFFFFFCQRSPFNTIYSEVHPLELFWEFSEVLNTVVPGDTLLTFPPFLSHSLHSLNFPKMTSKINYTKLLASTCAFMGNPAMWETWVRSLGWEDPLEEGMATHSSILAWRIPLDRRALWATVPGVAKSRTQLSN